MRQPKQKQFAPQISLQRLSSKSTNLQSLIRQAAQRRSLEDILNETLPAAFKEKFQLNSFSNGLLVLTCSSAAVMTKFRFSQDQFLSMLNAKIHPEKATHIRIKIRPAGSFQKKNAAKAMHQQKPLSKKNAQILLEEAEHTDDTKLKNILLQLAKRTD